MVIFFFLNTSFKEGSLTRVKPDGEGSPPTHHPFKKNSVIYSIGFYFGIGRQLSLVLDRTEVVWVGSLLMLELL